MTTTHSPIPPPPGLLPPPGERRVLVVDDDPAARDWMNRVLGRAGYRVTAVGTAAEGARLAAERPDLIICDVNLPDGSGLSLAARLRGDPRTAHIPLLQVSAVRITPPERAAGLRSGADAYLVGSLDPDEVLAVAEALLRARAAERSAEAALDRLGRLQAVTAALARAGTLSEVIAHLTDALHTAYGANGVGIGVLDEDGAVIVLVDEHALFHLPGRWPVDRSTPFGRAVLDGAPVVVADQRERAERFPALAGLVTGTEASIDLPLSTPGGEVLGVLGIGFAAVGVVTDELAHDLQVVADTAGQALHRARLDAAERSSRRRFQVLQELTGALSRAAGQTSVARTAVRHGAAALGASGAALLLRENGAVRVLAVLGGPDDAPTLPPGWPAPTALVRGGEVFPGAEPQPPAGGGPVLAVLPMQQGRRAIGVLCLAWPADERLAAGDRELARAIAEHTAEALLRAGAADRERAAFLELQHRLLPRELPRPPRWELVGRYRPSADGSAVGGDWYDAVVQPDGRLTLVIGDVSGHGTSAAATMSRLRHTMHAYLALGTPPEQAFRMLSGASGLDHAGLFATALAVTVDPAGDRLSLVSAGHPPPLLMSAAGEVHVLDTPPNRPVGVAEDWEFAATTTACPAGVTLLLYTDGLVERRDADFDAGLRRLRAALPRHLDLEATADEVLRRCSGADDDTAIILARHAGP